MAAMGFAAEVAQGWEAVPAALSAEEMPAKAGTAKVEGCSALHLEEYPVATAWEGTAAQGWAASGAEAKDMLGQGLAATVCPAAVAQR